MTHPTPPTASTRDLVVLVDDHDNQIGTAPRLSVHTENTPLHRAFSVYLMNSRGEVLFTRRALEKRTWPGVWTNSCCGHPAPGESTEDAIRRRVAEELGAQVACVDVALPGFRYRATDASGVVENEVCPVWVGSLIDDALDPDPAEVVEHAWLPWQSVVASITHTPRMFSPWSALQVPQLDGVLGGWLDRMTLPGSPVDETLRAVDGLVRAECGQVARLWERLSPGGADVIDVDLPGWLEELLGGGGKRLRPMMCHWGFVAAGGFVGGHHHRHVVQAAAAMEILHAFALVHDDVMDESAQRRGMPAAHIRAATAHRHAKGHGAALRFGDNIAILLGDLAHHVATHLAAGLPPRMQAVWNELCIELIAGQRADLTGAAAARDDRQLANRVAELKSGAYTVQRPLQLGALASNARPETLQALHQYGHHVGRAFAWRDDVLGVWGDPASTGKPVGDDLAAGKPTLIHALGCEMLSGEALDVLHRAGTPAAEGQDVALLRNALESAGVRREIDAMISAEIDLAAAALQSTALTPEGRQGLTELATDVAWRKS